MEMGKIILLQPYFLLLLPFAALVVFFLVRGKKAGTYFTFFDDIKAIYKRSSQIFFVKIALLCLIFLNFIVLLSDPHRTNNKTEISKNGIDIILALDVSSSMLANDLQPNRMESAKAVVRKFIQKLETDRIGLVMFAGKPFTSVPLTFDYSIVSEIIDGLSTDTIYGINGTAIGDAILSSVNTIEKISNSGDKEIREKVIVLATDGEANIGIDPLLASKMAKEKSIKIYTIGIGSETGTYIDYQDFFGMRKQRVDGVDEKTLRAIADITNGKYFNATDNDSFTTIFDEISKLEKSEISIQEKKEYTEYYTPFIFIGTFLLLLYFSLHIFWQDI